MTSTLKVGDHIKTSTNDGWFYGEVVDHETITPPLTLDGRKPPLDHWMIEAREFRAGRRYIECLPGKEIVQ